MLGLGDGRDVGVRGGAAASAGRGGGGGAARGRGGGPAPGRRVGPSVAGDRAGAGCGVRRAARWAWRVSSGWPGRVRSRCEEFAVSELAAGLGDVRAGGPGLRRAGRRAPGPVAAAVGAVMAGRSRRGRAARSRSRPSRSTPRPRPTSMPSSPRSRTRCPAGGSCGRSRPRCCATTPPGRRTSARAAEKRGVWVEDRIDGTTEITAVTGTPDAHAFDQALDRSPPRSGRSGTPTREQVRRAKGVGVLADPQYALDLHATAEPPPTAPSGPAAAGRHRLGRARRSTCTCTPTPSSGSPVSPGWTGSRGARSLAAVRQWLADLAPGATIRVTPVVDLTEQIARRRLRGPRPAPRPGHRTRPRRVPVPLVRPPGPLRPRPHRAPTSTPTTAAHRARRAPRTSPGCAVSTTGSRPTADWPYHREPTGS